MDGISDRMLRDLQESLDRTFGEDSNQALAAGYLEVCVRHNLDADWLTVGLPAASLTAWLKNRLKRAHASGGLRPLSSVLGDQLVNIEARLGDATLSLDELATLQPGDVLVLDHRLEDPIHLTLPGGDVEIAHAGLTEIDGDRALVLTDPPRKE